MLNKLRYKLIVGMIKKLTPDLYKKMKIVSLVDTKFNNHSVSQNAFTPRPAILFMKEYFDSKELTGLEIGVEYGYNAKSILQELPIKKLYLLDLWSKNEQYENLLYHFYSKNLLGNKVIMVKNNSQTYYNKFENNSLDFIYIDGNHTYEYVYKDIYNYFNKIKIGGIIAGHDTFTYPDVLEAVRDFTEKYHISFTIKLPDFYFIKPNIEV